MPEAEKIELQPLTICNHDFNDVIDRGTLFVDKTAKLADLVQNQMVFLARPRRMGKSTLLSMLKELFTHGAKDNHYFDGLAVQSQWSDPHCYPVVRLFLDVSHNPTTFERDLGINLCSAFYRAGFDSALTLALQNFNLSDLLLALGELVGSTKIVVLVDEWDYSLSKNIDNYSAYEACRQVLCQLFGWLLDLNNLRFCLITGVGLYQESALIRAKNIVDISMESWYSDLVGYTEDEVKNNFAPYIRLAINLLECSEDEFLWKLKQHYAGFCFDENAENIIYCPYSVNSFFNQLIDHPDQKPEFMPFWILGARFLKPMRAYLASYNFGLDFLDKINHIEVTQSDFAPPTASARFGFFPLMMQVGCFSIKSVSDPNITSYRCYFSNKEIEKTCANIYLHYITQRWGMSKNVFNDKAKALFEALVRQDISAVAGELNGFLIAIPYVVWTKTTEIALHTFIAWIILFSYLSIYTRETTFTPGQSDIQIELKEKLYDIELKTLPVGANEHDVVQIADAAQTQIMARTSSRNLHPWQQARLKRRYALVLVVAAETRQVCYWRLIELESHQVLGSDWVEAWPEPEVKDVFKAIIMTSQSFTSQAVAINPDDLVASLLVLWKIAKQHGPDAADKEVLTVAMRAVFRDAQARKGVKWFGVDTDCLSALLVNTVCEMLAADTHQVCFWRRNDLDANKGLGSDLVEALPEPKNENVESKTAEKTEVVATEESNTAEQSEVVVVEASKAAEQSEEGASSQNSVHGSEPLGDQQNMQFEIALKSCIGLASKTSQPTKLVAINSEQLVAGLLPLFSTMGQAGTKMDPKWVKRFVLNTITATTVAEDSNAVKVDPDFLAAQITSRLNDLV